MSWVFEIGQGPLRAYVGSMYGRGAPYRMTVTRPDGACSTFLGLRSLTSAVEAFCTAADVFGTPVPAGRARPGTPARRGSKAAVER